MNQDSAFIIKIIRSAKLMQFGSPLAAANRGLFQNLSSELRIGHFVES
jgi:hypothetical protein